MVPLAGRRLADFSLDALRGCEAVRSIVVAAPPGHVHDFAGGDLGVVPGGATRSQSVANALEAVGTELVAIHDAARPLLTPALLEAVVATLVADDGADAAIAAAPLADTIKRARASGEGAGGFEVAATVERSELWAAQTPQVFRTVALRKALAVPPEVRDAATDEAMLIEARGGRVLLCAVAEPNLKVTTQADLRLAELLLGGGR